VLEGAIALAYAKEGASVVINYTSNQTAAEEVVEAIRKEKGGRAILFKADVAKAAEAEALVQKGIEEFGSLDILVK